ncbi:g2556 [Coccomyxa viridis]|uniref:G2556 protein n=1 Tax=Coccomyxa viridis TaxID=1274662 RepID=A0ABP1FKM6_9CHLO
MKAALQQAAPESDPDSWNTSDDDAEDEVELPAAHPLELTGGMAAAAKPEDSGELADAEDMQSEEEGEEDADKAAANRRKGATPASARHADASASDSDPDADERPSGPGGAIPDNKAASFARAFAKIMESAGPGRGLLQGSKSLSKRKREVETEEQVERDARQLRREMRMRGHVRIPTKGKDPVMDARETAFSRIATRGVVRLFNAVAKAQKQQEEAQEGGAKAKGAAQISKAAFLAELQGKLAKPQSEQMVPSAPSRQKAGIGAAMGAAPAAAVPGGLVGSAGSGLKMKDWDKALADSDEEEQDRAGGSEDGSSDEDDDADV